jgi:hypothetical protein
VDGATRQEVGGTSDGDALFEDADISDPSPSNAV